MQNQPVKKPNKIRDLLIGRYRLVSFLIAVLILGLGYFLLLGPKYRELKNGGQFDLKGKQAELVGLKQQLANLKALRQSLADLEKQDLSVLKFILPAKRDLPGLLVQLEKIASENNFILLSVGITPVTVAAGDDFGLKKLNLSLSLAGGGYADLLRLLDVFEYNLRLLDVASINFTPNQTSSGLSSYTINLITYYLVD